jgi:sec-independent protein translocase protein TatA
MGTLSVWHILIVAAIILLLFGGQGKISDLMGDVGRGIKAFRIGLAQPQNNPEQPPDPAPQSGRVHLGDATQW